MMTTLIILLLLAVIGWIGWKMHSKPDANDDGIVNSKDAFAAAREAVAEAKAAAKKTLDANQDGKVNSNDAKEVIAKVEKEVKRVRRKRVSP